MKMGILSFLMRYFRNEYVMASATAIILNNKGEVLLGKRAPNVVFPLFWGLPGGMIEYGEPLADAIRREIAEELGVEVTELKRAKGIYENFPKKGKGFQIFHTIDIPHYCKIRGTPKAKDETLEVRWFKPEEINNMKLAYNHKAILAGEGII